MKQTDPNSPVNRAQKELFQSITGLPLPAIVTTLQGASAAIKYVTRLRNGEATVEWGNVLLPPECSTTKWAAKYRKQANGEVGFTPLEGASTSPISINDKRTPAGSLKAEAAAPAWTWPLAGTVSMGYVSGEQPQVAEYGDYVVRPEVDEQLAWAIDQVLKGSRVHWPNLVGYPGTGKDTALRYHAALRGTAYHVQGYDSNADRKDIVGSLELEEGDSGNTVTRHREGAWLEYSQLPAIVANSEVNFAVPGRLGILQTCLSERQMYVKEAGKVYVLHPQNVQALNSNPAKTKYGANNSGTNPLPAALENRLWTIEVPAWTKDELAKTSMAKSAYFDKASQLYVSVHNAIARDGLKTNMSMRNMRRLISALDSGMPVNEAVHGSLSNEACNNGGAKAYKQVIGLAKHIWTAEVHDMTIPKGSDKKEDE